MSIRRLLVGISVAAVVCFGAKEYKVGYIDSEEIISKYEAAKEAKKTLDTEIAKFRSQADSLRADYEKAQEEYASQELTLSEEGKQAKLAEVNQRKRRYDGYVDEVYREGGKVDQKNEELLAPIVVKINAVVSKLAVDDGYSLVFDASKSDIVYAQAGLDMTDEVVAELNREYAPTGPTVVRKVVYAVMSIYESNDQARQDNIGSQIRQFSYDLVRAQPNVDMIANQKADDQAQARGYGGRQIGQQEALDVARSLNADYAIFGECSKQDRKITFSLTIADVQLGTVARTESGEANRIEDLRQQVAGVVQVLMTSVQKP